MSCRQGSSLQVLSHLAAGEQVALQPALAHVLGEHGVHDPAGVGQILVARLDVGVPHAGGGLEHGGQAVGFALIRAKDAEVFGRLVFLDDVPDVCAQHEHVLGLDGTGSGQVHAVLAEVRQLQVPQELAAVGVRVGAHAVVAHRGQGLEVGAELALLGEELFGLIAAQPGL